MAVFVLPLSAGAQKSAFPTPEELREELKSTNVCLLMEGFHFPGGVENGTITGQGTKIIRNDKWWGSGFIVHSDGTIVTNYHVAQRAVGGIAIFADGSRYDVIHIKVYDPVNDLAVLKIRAQRQFPAVTLGNSDTVRELDEVVAVGNPEGMGIHMTRGNVSQLVRDDHGGLALIRHTAQIAPGSSGGSLYKGRSVIGVNASVRLYSEYGTPTGFNNAIPINKVGPLLQYSELKPLRNIFNPDFDYLVNNRKISEQGARNGRVDGKSGETPGAWGITGVALDALGDYIFILDVQTEQRLSLGIINRREQVVGFGGEGMIFLSNEFRQEGLSILVLNNNSSAVNFGLHICKILW
jgi:hypothetical protein